MIGVCENRLQGGDIGCELLHDCPRPELEQLRGLAVEAIGVYLRGEMEVTQGDIGWKSSLRQVQKDMERIVDDLMRIRSFAGQQPFGGFRKRCVCCSKILKNWT